ncbi:MAG: outer membrane protein assembly factor BamE [Pseudomonadota bacterium]
MQVLFRFFVLCAFVLAGCSPTFDNHGYIPAVEDVAALRVGVDDKTTVAEAIGRPTSTGVLNEDGWYYIRTTVRNFTYNEPEVVERELLAISFDRNDRVRNIETLTLADGRIVDLNRRVTELPVRGPTFWQQLIGSLGNITADQLIQ